MIDRGTLNDLGERFLTWERFLTDECRDQIDCSEWDDADDISVTVQLDENDVLRLIEDLRRAADLLLSRRAEAA
jgi:hypothetical protein